MHLIIYRKQNEYMIYLDNASTTKPSEAVKKAVMEAMESFGNPSSMHRLGIDAENIIKKAKENASKVLGVAAKDIYFTSGGTESNNTAILGYCRKNAKKGRHIITTKVEHPSVLVPFKILEDEGFSVTYLDVDEKGVISIEDFSDALCEDTIFVSVMLVNNEVGSIMPVDKLKPLMREKSPKAVLHVDAVQGFGKVMCKPSLWGVDMLSASGHKIHAIKGCGILYIADKVNLSPLINGGGQQKDMRSGTENVVGIAAISKACEEIVNYKSEYVKSVRERLKGGILENIENVKINEADKDSQAGHILNVSILGVKAEILLHSLEMHEVYVSTGSACSTNKPMPSHVLTAMGCDKAQIEGAIRFSLSENLSEKDIDTAVGALVKETAQIRKYVR